MLSSTAVCEVRLRWLSPSASKACFWPEADWLLAKLLSKTAGPRDKIQNLRKFAALANQRDFQDVHGLTMQTQKSSPGNTDV